MDVCKLTRHNSCSSVSCQLKVLECVPLEIYVALRLRKWIDAKDPSDTAIEKFNPPSKESLFILTLLIFYQHKILVYPFQDRKESHIVK